MRFTRIAFQWLVIALIVAGISWVVFTRKNLPDYGRATWSQRDGFFAISFKGMAPDVVRNYQFLLSQVVTRFKNWINGAQDEPYKKEIISNRRLAALMEALKDQGYVPLKTQDLIEFYTNGAPLPEKAIYIMFEGGRKDSLLFAHPILQDLGFNAALYVYGDKVAGTNPFFLRRQELRGVANNQFWDVESMGYDSQCINTALSKDCIYPLTDYLRDSKGKAIESKEEAIARIFMDYKKAETDIFAVTKIKPRAYCFIPANTLQLLPKDLADANAEAMQRDYEIAFTRAGSPYNSRNENRFRLTRFQVPSDWTPAQLLAELEHNAPMRFTGQPLQCDQERLWRLQLGSLVTHPRSLIITSPAENDGFALLRGSETIRALGCSMTVYPDKSGESDVYFRYSNPKSYIRVRVLYEALQVQESTAAGLTTLLQYPLPEPGKPVRLAVQVKGNRVTMQANDIPTSQYPLPLHGAGQGSFGVGVRGENAPFLGRFDDVTVRVFPPRWAEVASADRIGATAASSLTAILIPWPDRADQCPDTTALMAAAMRGIGTYLMVPGAPEAAIQKARGCLEKEPGMGDLTLLLVSGFALDYDPAVPAAGYAAAIATAHEHNQQVALRLGHQQLAAFLKVSGVVPDWFLLDVADEAGDPGLAVLKHRFDKGTMLFRRKAADASAPLQDFYGRD